MRRAVVDDHSGGDIGNFKLKLFPCRDFLLGIQTTRTRTAPVGHLAARRRDVSPMASCACPCTGSFVYHPSTRWTHWQCLVSAVCGATREGAYFRRHHFISSQLCDHCDTGTRRCATACGTTSSAVIPPTRQRNHTQTRYVVRCTTAGNAVLPRARTTAGSALLPRTRRRL